jgi:hypothetical protein
MSGLTLRQLASERPTWLYDRRRDMQVVLRTARTFRVTNPATIEYIATILAPGRQTRVQA